MVKHDELAATAGSGEGHLYSSKPPLLATLMAGAYWLIHQRPADAGHASL